ncbi:hypothetical protein BH18ACI4_BH18ACI4_19960 [soil metagenome]
MSCINGVTQRIHVVPDIFPSTFGIALAGVEQLNVKTYGSHSCA